MILYNQQISMLSKQQTSGWVKIEQLAHSIQMKQVKHSQSCRIEGLQQMNRLFDTLNKLGMTQKLAWICSKSSADVVIKQPKVAKLLTRTMMVLKEQPAFLDCNRKRQFVDFLQKLEKSNLMNNPLRKAISGFLASMGPIRDKNCIECNKNNKNAIPFINSPVSIAQDISKLDSPRIIRQLEYWMAALLNDGGGYLKLRATVAQIQLISQNLNNKDKLTLHPKHYQFEIISNFQSTQTIRQITLKFTNKDRRYPYLLQQNSKSGRTKLVLLNRGLRGKIEGIQAYVCPDKLYEIITEFPKKSNQLSEQVAVKHKRCITYSEDMLFTQYIGIDQSQMVPQQINGQIKNHNNNYLVIFNAFDKSMIDAIYQKVKLCNIKESQLIQLEYDQCPKKIWYLGFQTKQSSMLEPIEKSTGITVDRENAKAYLKKCSRNIIIKSTSNQKLLRYQTVYYRQFMKKPKIIITGTNADSSIAVELEFKSFEESIFSYVYLQNFFFKPQFQRKRSMI